MKIGMKAPTLRVPCIFNNTFSFLPFCNFQQSQFALCCLSHLKETDAWFLEAQAQEFTKSGSALVILVSDDTVLGQDWGRPPQDFGIPFFIDPINRLKKSLRLARSLRPHRCETLIFDQDTRLQFRLIHDLSLKGISSVLDIIESDFEQHSPELPHMSNGDAHRALQSADSQIEIKVTA